MKRPGLLLLTFLLLAGGAPHPSRAEPEHIPPQGPAKVAFAPGFPALKDHKWGFPLGGFGGLRPAPR